MHRLQWKQSPSKGHRLEFRVRTATIGSSNHGFQAGSHRGCPPEGVEKPACSPGGDDGRELQAPLALGGTHIVTKPLSALE